jgi:hypothetical protein
MKNKYILAVKFFTETKNDEQLILSYKEIESFLDNFYTFKFFFKFSTSNIKYIDDLPEEIK